VYDLDQVKPIDEETVTGEQAPATLRHAATGAIKVRNELIGEVAVEDVESNDELAAGMLAVVTERLGTHIENLRLLEETERSRQQLDKRAAELETVARVSTAATTILSPQELLQSVVDLTKYSFSLYHTQVYLLDDSKEALVLKAGAGKIGHRMASEGERIALHESKSVVVRAAQTRMGVVVNDVRQDQDYLPHALLPDALSEMAIPMVVGDQLVGVFDVLASTTDRFTEEDMRTYNTLASQVAVALRNAELYAEQMATVVRLRELDHLKSSFLANMSHELRTPLNSILGFAQVILEGLDGPLTDNMANDLGLIDKNGQHLLSLINELLDMAKIEAGRLSLSPEPVNLRMLLEDVLETTGSLAREKSLYMRLESDEQIDTTLMLDYTRMRQVFINLIGNATKFTETGGVTVTIKRMANKVAIHFRDTGIGIPPNQLDMIFEQFSQVDTSTTRKAGGTGLGLPISRRLVELHGGRLFATSSGVPGEGSVFTVELPLTQASKV
jgi:signal transduction histidine kinase